MNTCTNNCPYCKKEVTLSVERWNTEEPCPLCTEIIEIKFDFIYMPELNDEWDLYSFKKKEKRIE